MGHLEEHFDKFRENILGIDAEFTTPYGVQRVNYGDWIASGRLYEPIEQKLCKSFGPYVANTHTETSELGVRMTQSYLLSHKLIKDHVNAGPSDVIITAGSGMTAVVNKFQRILGLKHNANKKETGTSKPVVFITHMEHHSNQTSWYETIADVVVIEPDENLLISTDNLRKKLEEYKNREFKMGSFTACSNVTGIRTPIHEMAKIMHEFGGVCFIDYAASAPYDDMDMHPEDPLEKLDAVMFSPHKFLGGPGSSGVLVFDSSMYKNAVPDHPGGGTVDWTNPWGNYKYVDNIEAREDGGTPGFLQSIKTALCFDLKDKMGVKNMRAREEELLEIAFKGLDEIDDVHILANNERDRLGILSFYVKNQHYNLVVKLLNDLYGIQVRGGCACAGTYGHYLLEVSYELSKSITDKIDHGDLSGKPGWIRWSLHPTTTNEEVHLFLKALKDIVQNIETYRNDYVYERKVNSFFHKNEPDNTKLINDWFTL